MPRPKLHSCRVGTGLDARPARECADERMDGGVSNLSKPGHHPPTIASLDMATVTVAVVVAADMYSRLQYPEEQVPNSVRWMLSGSTEAPSPAPISPCSLGSRAISASPSRQSTRRLFQLHWQFAFFWGADPVQPMARRAGVGMLIMIIVAFLGPILAQAPPARAQTLPETRELVVGTKVAPPFAMRAEDGTWHGISIDLWRRIASQNNLRYRFQETTLLGLTHGVADGSFDAAVAALTVTGPRYRAVDFTQPFYSSGLGIAVKTDAGITWWPIVGSVFSIGFLRAVAMLFAVSLAVGIVLWLIERRHNEHFGTHRRGFGSSLWWSAVAMTQSGSAAGEKVPVTLLGRLLAIVWMVVSVIVIASFTAALSSQLTVKRLTGTVHEEADLRYARVAAIAGTETTEYLSREHIPYQPFADVGTALSALQKDRIDALVYDRPLLTWLVNERFSGSLKVLDATFDPQVYAIALPRDSALRTPINLSLIDVIRSDWWREMLVSYLGRS
jgi:polar amino acid transport system substrate-binding protein